MVPEDLAQTEVALRHVPEVPSRILLLSPNREQYCLFRKTFPRAKIYVSNRHSWDLAQSKDWYFDIIFAGNVMHYARDPARWWKNVLRCCRRFVVQDLIDRRRSILPPFLGADGDRIRYELPSHGVRSTFSSAFDLARFAPETFLTYGTMCGGLHFVGVFPGQKRPSTSLAPFLTTAWFHIDAVLRQLGGTARSLFISRSTAVEAARTDIPTTSRKH